MKSIVLKRIASELAVIHRDLSAIAADKSPTKDGAKALFEAYKKEHPGTEKTPKDFYEAKPKKEKVEKLSRPERNAFVKESTSAITDILEDQDFKNKVTKATRGLGDNPTPSLRKTVLMEVLEKEPKYKEILQFAKKHGIKPYKGGPYYS
jgi:hypothetical protein